MRLPWWRTNTPKIAQVLVAPNGMVVVFDEHDQQIPAYQGIWTQKRTKILKHFSGTVEYLGESAPRGGRV